MLSVVVCALLVRCLFVSCLLFVCCLLYAVLVVCWLGARCVLLVAQRLLAFVCHGVD